MTQPQALLDQLGWTPPATWQPGKQLKPAGCSGCPMQHKSLYYVPDEWQPSATTLVLTQNPGANEERLGLPACGKTGQLLNQKYLPLAGLQRGQVSVATVVKCRYGNSNDPPPDEIRQQVVKHCTEQYLQIPDTIDTVILQGQVALDYAAKYMVQPDRHDSTNSQYTITDWRGYLLPDIRSDGTRSWYVTEDITRTFHDPTMSWVSDLDWRRVVDVRTGRYPLPHPHWRVADTERVDAATVEFFTHASESPGYCVVDTEFNPATRHLTILGVLFHEIQDCAVDAGHKHNRVPSDRSLGTHARVEVPRETQHQSTSVLSVDWKACSQTTRDYVKHELRGLVRTKPVVFHNAMADVPVLEQAMAIQYEDYYQIEDTMLAHAVLWSELPHALEFLASVYGKYGKFKHLRLTDELLYNYGDVVDTDCVWQGMLQGFKSDRQAEEIYRSQSLTLLPVLLEARREGIRVSTERVLEVFQEYYTTTQQLARYAQLVTGYDLNLNSGHQLKHYLYTVRKYPVQVNKETRQPTTNDDAVSVLRAHVLPYDTQAELTFDRDDNKQYSVLRRVELGADPVLECRALWSQCWHTVNNYIIGLCKGVYGEYDKTKRKKAREQYWRVGLRADDVVYRVYPNFATHAQKTGRWSTTDPPLAQLPASLRDIVCPGPDEVCVSWDWSAIEPRVLQALTHSTLLKRTFDENFDLHTWTVCYMFGYEFPPDLVDPHRAASCEAWRARYNWKGKDDPRRVFAKQGRYEMWYGGTGSNAAQAAASFGLNARDLKLALSKLATSDPAYFSWRVKTEAEAKQTGLIRTFMGRPRRFLSKGDAMLREGINQPMQGAVSDIFNTTIVMLKREFPFLRWGWGMHDSQKWYVAATRLTHGVFQGIRNIVERTHTIAGQVTKFPGDFEVILPPERGNLKLTPEQYFSQQALV